MKPVFQDTERVTSRTNPTLQEFQAIAQVFDSATHMMRLEMVELVRGFVELPPEDRRMTLALVARLNLK